MELPVDRYCFVCGPENPAGLGVVFHAHEGKAVAAYVIRTEHQGYAGISHGGILAALLDEAMVYAAVTLGRWAATAELTVRYHRSVPTGEELRIEAVVLRSYRRVIECRAEIRSAGGSVLTSATAKLMQGRALTEEERTEAVRGMAVPGSREPERETDETEG